MSFRFETLLGLQQSRRDQAAAEVGKVNQAIAKVESEIAQIDAEIAGAAGHADGRTGAIAVDRLLHQGRYALQLSADRNGLQQTLQTLRVEHQDRLDRLAAAQGEVKKFEWLREKHLRQQARQQQQREQQAIDEAASRSHRRRGVSQFP